MKLRGLRIALAVLLAILGTVGVVVYVSHANARALAGQRAVTVLVAHQLIPSGTSASAAQQQGLLGTERLPASSVPADALTAITPDIGSLVTDAAVQPGQLLLRPMLVTAAQVTNGFTIPNGKVAVSVLFCVPEAVAGYLHAGAQVAVFDTTVTGNANMTAQSACAGPHTWASGDSVKTKLVLPKVTILSVGPASATSQAGSQSGGAFSTSSSSSSSTSGSQNSELLTLAVSQGDAARLIELTQDGLPYLALLNASASPGVTTTGASVKG